MFLLLDFFFFLLVALFVVDVHINHISKTARWSVILKYRLASFALLFRFLSLIETDTALGRSQLWLYRIQDALILLADTLTQFESSLCYIFAFKVLSLALLQLLVSVKGFGKEFLLGLSRHVSSVLLLAHFLEHLVGFGAINLGYLLL